MRVVVKVNGLRYGRVPREPEQFYHSCGTQSSNARNVDVVDVASEFDAIARGVECLKPGSAFGVGPNVRTNGARQAVADRPRQRGGPFEAGAHLNPVGLALSGGAPIQAVCRQLVATVANVCARRFEKCCAHRRIEGCRVRQEFHLRRTSYEQPRECVARGEDSLVEAVEAPGSTHRDGNHDGAATRARRTTVITKGVRWIIALVPGAPGGLG